MGDKVLEWIKSKNITSHAIAGVIVTVCTILATDTEVRDFFIKNFQTHPKIVATIFSIAAIVLKYSHSSSPADLQTRAAAAVNPEPPPQP